MELLNGSETFEPLYYFFLFFFFGKPLTYVGDYETPFPRTISHTSVSLSLPLPAVYFDIENFCTL